MTILYTLLIIWVVVGLLLYLASMVTFKADINTISSVVKDADTTSAIMKLSKKYDDMPILGKIAYFLFMLFLSPILLGVILFKKKGSAV